MDSEKSVAVDIYLSLHNCIIELHLNYDFSTVNIRTRTVGGGKLLNNLDGVR